MPEECAYDTKQRHFGTKIEKGGKKPLEFLDFLDLVSVEQRAANQCSRVKLLLIILIKENLLWHLIVFFLKAVQHSLENNFPILQL